MSDKAVKTITIMDESVRRIKALVMDAIGTTDPISLLDLVDEIDRATFVLDEKRTGTVFFEIVINHVKLTLLGGNIHAKPGVTWDIFINAIDLDYHFDQEWVCPSACITTARMVKLLKEFPKLQK